MNRSLSLSKSENFDIFEYFFMIDVDDILKDILIKDIVNVIDIYVNNEYTIQHEEIANNLATPVYQIFCKHIFKTGIQLDKHSRKNFIREITLIYLELYGSILQFLKNQLDDDRFIWSSFYIFLYKVSDSIFNHNIFMRLPRTDEWTVNPLFNEIFGVVNLYMGKALLFEIKSKKPSKLPLPLVDEYFKINHYIEENQNYLRQTFLEIKKDD